MSTLQKFKLLATQCGAAQSPTRSPTASPVVHLRRPKTNLRMLLTGRSSGCRELSNQQSSGAGFAEKKNNRDMSGRTLKDLFVSSPPWVKKEEEADEVGAKMEIFERKLNGFGSLAGGPGSPRAGWVRFRHRLLLRKAWRPVLAPIPE